MRLSKRVKSLEPSITLTLFARAKALAASGKDVVNMAVGEPDFAAPKAVQRAAVAKVQGGEVRYTPAAGTPGLRKAIAKYLERSRGGAWSPEEVTVCHSAKHALSGSLLALLEAGDEVVVPLPAWSSYFELIRLAGGTPVPVLPGPGCAPDLDAIEAALSPRTRVVMICSPGNPSGYVWTKGEIERLSQLAVERDFVILSDEIYRALVFEGDPAYSPTAVSPEAREHTIIVDGASKSFAMTGYRIGFLAAPRAFALGVANLHGQMTGSPNAVSQAAYGAGLREDPPELAAMLTEFDKRRQVLLAGLADLGLTTPHPRGAFYAFPDVSSYLDQSGSAGFCKDLLEETGLALIPGSAFGLDAHVRLSYAVKEALLRDALGRLGRFIKTRA